MCGAPCGLWKTLQSDRRFDSEAGARPLPSAAPPGWLAGCCRILTPSRVCCAGGGFEAVSCPHYLGEVVIYAGLVAALAGRRTTGWLMLLWVVSAVQCVPAAADNCMLGWSHAAPRSKWGEALPFPPPRPPLLTRYRWAACCLPPVLQVTNLSLAAGMTHRWYRQHYKTYPKHRRALVPLLY